MLGWAENTNMSSYVKLESSDNPSHNLDESAILLSKGLSSENLESSVAVSQNFKNEKKHPERSSENNNSPNPHASKQLSRNEEGDDADIDTPCLEKQRELEAMSPSDNLTISRSKTQDVAGLDRLLKGPWAQSNTELLFNISSGSNVGLGDTSNNKPQEGSDNSDKENDVTAGSFITARSKTMPTLSRPKMTPQKVPSLNDGERLTKAKEIVERAIKYKKVFTIQGGYSTIRHCLRRRGWVEKFYKIPIPQKKPSVVKKQKSSDEDDNDFDDDVVDDDDDDDDDADIATQATNDKTGPPLMSDQGKSTLIDGFPGEQGTDDQPKIPPWEEDDGIYGIMSRLVRNVTPSLFWVLKRDAIDYRYLTKDQMVNHYCKAGSFTTKVGLCVNMKNVVWFDNCDHDTFFPRCYRLSHDEERDAFIDDYRLTACMNIIKVAIKQHGCWNQTADEGKNKTQSCSNPDCAPRRSSRADKCVCLIMADESISQEIKTQAIKTEELTAEIPKDDDWQPVITQLAALKKKNKQRYVIPVQVLETAIYQCEKFLASKDHEDIDVPREVGQLTDQQWDDLIKWYYQLVQEEGTFSHIPLNLAKQCESLTRRLACYCPQFEMDGIRNVWIVKPGAKSRGRGITCYEKLEDMLKLVCTQVVKKDGKFVVQKYIERPLLIYNTKFDIRQWFLVTDWNPLTLWFYRDSYLRFCSQQFTLEDFDQSIHLSNNAVQKHYKNGPRSSRLPDENMWTKEEFKAYLATKKHPNVWDEKIYPQMKRAIVCALLVTQDLVEYRKSSFELYGADFMLTEDFRPWLIEINSSPSMESSTSVTAKLCAAVLDDTIKVVVDRKFDRSCDIGQFELAYKQPLVTVPPYIGISLCVEGQAIKKPSWAVRPNRESEPGRSSEPGGNDTLFTPRTVTTKPTLSERLLENGRNITNSWASSMSTAVGVDGIQIKKDSIRIPDVMNIKNLASSSSRVSKDAIAKVSTFRTPGDIDKIKVSTRTINATFSQTIEASSAISDQKGSSSVEEAARHTKKQARITERKNENMKGALTDSSFAVSKNGEISNDPSIQSGSIIQPMHLKMNPSCVHSFNQRRSFTKSSAAANCPIPAVPGAERTSQNRAVVASNVKPMDLQTNKSNPKGNTTTSVGSWNRACQWCGRGGNLHLDSADPNCRCQKDSILISMQLGQANSRAQDLVIINNQQVHIAKTWPGQSKNQGGRKPPTGTVSISGCLVDGDESTDSKTSTPVSYRVQNSRPSSALSVSLDCFNTNVNGFKTRPYNMKKSTSVPSHPPDSTFNNLQYPSQLQLDKHIDQADLKQQYRSDSFSGSMQALTSSHHYKSYNSKHVHNSLPCHQHLHVNRGLLGSMLTTRVRNFLAKKGSSTNSIIKMWPSMAYIDSNRCRSPLSVIAHRHLHLKQQK